MFLFNLRTIVCALATLPPFAFSQGYSPGQVYSAGGQRQAPAYTPAATAAPLYNMPAQSTPAGKPAATKQSKPQQSRSTASETRPKSSNSAPKPKATPRSTEAAEATPQASPKAEAPVSTPRKSAAASSSSTPSIVVTSWPTGKKLVALTYDDGPDPFTPKLLEYLNENKVPATFYMLGERVKEYPHMVEEIVRTGHELGNHTYDHKQLTKMSAEGVRQELSSTHDLLTSASNGAPVPTMRPPYGAQNATVRAVCEELGYKVLLWDVDTNDWMGRPAAQMINTILKGTSDGSIILMHDRVHRKTDTVLPTTKAIVPELRARGYTFVTVSQLLSNRRGTAAADAPTSGSAVSPEAAPAATSPQ